MIKSGQKYSKGGVALLPNFPDKIAKRRGSPVPFVLSLLGYLRLRGREIGTKRDIKGQKGSNNYFNTLDVLKLKMFKSSEV